MNGDSQYDGIAIIGMAGRFPGADSIEEFWDNLVHGRESVSFFSDAELRNSGLDPDALRSRGCYVAARGLLKDIECFDAAFFGIHPREAEVMDPQQRIFLETCWAALERAGYAPNQIDAIVGVFGGVSFNTFYLHALHIRPDLLEMVGPEQVMFGNEKDYVTTRVAYKLGLKGPALNVSTACSTSLVAVAQACQSLLTYQCDFALAGGASVTVPQVRGYFHDEGNIGSADGHTRTFDAQASGTAFGNGVGIVVLKRIEDAIRDHDQVFAVIKGAALNNDGSQRVSFGAPGVDGQAKVISLAHALAGVEARSISYVEAHGTATPLGDPIEVAGLTKAFREGTDARQFCAIGSVKSNIGHLDVAAGVTGLIKTALALHHKLLPASLHYSSPNPKLNLESSPFFVNAKLRDWERENGIPRRAGVSSFGTGGTNAHVILEEAPELPLSDRGRPWQLLPLSAKTPDALEKATAHLSDYLKKSANSTLLENQPAALADAAFTLQSGRAVFPYRRIVVCRDLNDGAAALDARDSKRVFSQHEQGSDPPVVLMFPGQGAQYPGMGSSLYDCEPVFRENVDRCFAVLKPLIEPDLRAVMFPHSGSEKDSQAQLQQTALTQPALFVIEYALAKLWMSWGIAPASMIGHSVGEYVAGCLAGVFQLEDALALVARRGALVQAQPGGAMLIVRQAEKEVLPLLTPELGIAAVNSPNLCVVSGPYSAVESLEKILETRGIVTRRLQTSHAFHSAMMDPVLEPFGALLKKVPLREPRIPYVSNVTADWITAAEATNPAYWAGHVRQTVRFADGVAKLMEESRNILLEVGPGQTLSTLARQHPDKQAEQNVFASLALSGEQELRGFYETLGRLWMSGVKIDWAQFYSNESRRRITLPSYPFERKRYWPQGAAKPAPTIAQESKPSADPSFSSPVLSSVPAETKELSLGLRKERLFLAVRSLLGELSGYDLSDADPSADLMELGFDSLLLTQASQVLHRKFGINITFRQLMEELSSVQSIASYLDDQMPPEAFSESRPAAPPVVAASQPSAMATPNTLTLEYLFHQQQQLTAQLLQLMGKQTASAGVLISHPGAPTAPTPSGNAAKPEGNKQHGPFKPFDRHATTALNPVQTQALSRLIGRYTTHSAKSKELAAQNRPILADPRSVAGFNRLWKEMVYPIVTTRSDGSKVWDVDGHEYIDFVMGFGASLFGHRPPFVLKAVEEQLKLGFEIGPIQPIAGEVAALLREFIGMDRVAFTNTGSEAVLAATRVARTVTGRNKIAVFAGAYHGIFDEVLFRPLTVNGELRTAPIAPGVPQSAVSEVIVLDYGNPQSLQIMRSRGSEVAAILVEPVQSRRLDLQPKEFLHQLREVASEIGAALVFDEVVTGFRVEPGGAQSYFGVRADLATYGKVIGGGLPIGVVAGSTKYMDALDGGSWQYGDASFPEVGVTFFAGTFVRHPLVLAAAKAVLTHLKQSGRRLQDTLTARTARLAEQLRAVIAEFDAPYTVTQFSSLIHINFPPDQKLAGLLYYLLRLRGIHIWDNRALILTTAHAEADLDLLVRSLRESLQEMQASGFIAGPSAAATKPPSSPIAIPSAIETGTAHTDDPSSFPLTEAQKEIWLAAQMGGEAAVAYNESLRFEFRGDFDVELFRESVQQLVKRHPILLASIDRNGQSQRLQPNLQLELPLSDLSARSPEEQAGALKELIEREISYRFDLTTGPLLQVQIVRLSPDRHVVIWTAHHIVCDGWSGGLIVTELGKIYTALKTGQSPELETPLAFRDYVEATQRDAARQSAAISYWAQKFSAIPPPLDLPADRPRSAVRTARASTVKRELSPALHQNLRRFAGQRRTTLVVLLMSGFKVLLHRLSGQSDLVLGLGVAGQATSGQNCLVGHCVNLVPIRSQLKSDESFESNLTSLKKSILDAYDHSQTTIGRILQHVNVPRTPDRPPLVEVIFNVDRELSDVQFHGLEFSCERNAKRALHYDLFLNVVEGPRGIYAECDFSPDLFDSSTILRWLGHYETLLASIIAEPTNSLATLRLLSDSESKTILETWNNTKAEYSGPQLLHELVEYQVQRLPDAPAVTFGEQTITYFELNKRANQLAHYLRKKKVGPDVLVGVFLERSIEMVVALLGVLKSGGAYVPIDPEYPPDRIAFMVRDCNCAVLLATEHLLGRLPAVTCAILDLKDDWRYVAQQSDTNPEPLATSENLAYVIYTSGSTGNPKGAMNSHRGIRNRLLWMQNEYPMTPKDRVLQKTPFSFDVSVWEFFWPLISGAHLVVAKPGGHRESDYLVSLIRAHEITITHFVPSMLAAFLAEPDVRHCASLRQVICSGEALSLSLQRDFFRLLPARLFNLYGPTETAVEVTYWECDRHSPLSTVPIGKPVGNTQVYVLDHCLHPVPIGVPGELYLGGVQVGRGYWNRPELTAQKFVPDPFSEDPQARLYKTGDLCRWLTNGTVDYLGRLDFQVKIHGLRIELGEIEAALNRHESVRQSIVVAHESHGDKSLVAYVEPRNGVPPSASDLRAHLKRDLPEYMIPSEFVALDALPISPNGKIDRKALPSPQRSNIKPEIETDSAAPNDSLEQMLSHLWAKILRVKRVGLRDNFFELGGHSLLALRLSVEVEKFCKKRLPLATFLQAPTIAQLAAILRRENWMPSWRALVPIRPAGSQPPLFLMHSHGGNVLEYYPLANLLAEDQPVFGLQAHGLDGHIIRGRSIEQIASAYLEEIRMLQPQGPYFLGGFCFGGVVAYEVAQQLVASGEEVALLAMIQTTNPEVIKSGAQDSSLRNWWNRLAKRVDLERSNLSHRGVSYLQERFRRALEVAHARALVKYDSLAGNGGTRRVRTSVPYILESLGIEHDRAFDSYQPRPYYGKVVLFRASKQLPELAEDRTLGWDAILHDNLAVLEIPGHQQNLLAQPNVTILAEKLIATLATARAPLEPELA
jgi:amino acid adenylation domain-containing protein